MYQIYNDDCFNIFPQIADNSIDMILCDLPYELTSLKWDKGLDLNQLRKEYLRILKPNRIIALFGIEPFTYRIMQVFHNEYAHCWYWKKNNKTCGLTCKIRPMRCIEQILIFRYSVNGDNKGLYQKTKEYLINERKRSNISLKEYQKILGNQMTNHYFTKGKEFSFPSRETYKKLQTTGYFKMAYDELLQLYQSEYGEGENEGFRYYPQGLVKLDKPKINRAEEERTSLYSCEGKKDSIQYYTNYPNELLEFDNVGFNGEKRYHPTQKPVALLEYLIKTYTKENETILDNCMGVGSTGVACIQSNRNFIGIELNQDYYMTAERRIKDAEENKT